jgi:hypothetical protein
LEPELPFEFFVEGVPVSSQSSSHGKEAWKEKIRAVAKPKLPDPHLALTVPLKIEIFLLLANDLEADVDNTIKPIQDALNGLVYADDHQIEDIHIAKFSNGKVLALSNPSDTLIDAAATARPVVYVKVYSAD